MVRDPREMAIIDVLDDTAVAVSEQATAYTDSFPLHKNATYAFEYQFSGTGTIDCKIELEQGNTAPATEGSSDSNFVVPEDAADFDVSITGTAKHVKAYTPAVTKYARGKITGQGSNGTSTELSVFNVCIEKNL